VEGREDREERKGPGERDMRGREERGVRFKKGGLTGAMADESRFGRQVVGGVE
jgi:hypothetical protein